MNIIETKDLIDEAFKSIEDGFNKMGMNIKNPSLIDRYLIAATYKIRRFSDAIILLSERGLTDEAIPILRSLIEHSINMRWIMNNNTKSRLKDYMNDLGEKGFGSSWTNVSLVDRMKEVGFNDRDYYDFCVKVTYSYSHVNSSSLNWFEVINHPSLNEERWSANANYVVIAQMLGHVMKALDTKFIGYFKNYDYIWNKIKVDPDVRNKFNKVKESFR